MSDDSNDPQDSLLARLAPQASIIVRLKAFAELGLTTSQIREAVGVSPESLRLWANGAAVRESNRRVLDALGTVAAILLESHEPEDVVGWLAKPGLRGVTALALLRGCPEAVIAAAQAHVAGRADQERAFLEQAVRGESPTVDGEQDDLLASSAAGVDRSSTQIKRLLLATLNQIAAGHGSAREVIGQLEARYEPEIAQLPNYAANRKFLDELKAALRNAGDAPAEPAISKLLTDESVEEQELLDGFGARGRELIGARCKAVLTYALSMRVIQTLWGVGMERQAACKLYVGEARVKSVRRSGDLPSFSDAGEVLRFLRATRYEKVVVPDAITSSLVAHGDVDLVLLGAQEVYEDADGRPVAFVATAGTDAILRAARARGVRVAILAERDKFSSARPDADPRRRVLPIALPPVEPDGAIEYANLEVFSDELCWLEDGDPVVFYTPEPVGGDASSDARSPVAAA